MKYTRSDIIIHLRIAVDDYIDTEELLDVFELIENALFQSDSRDVHHAANVLRLPQLAADAAKQRIREFKYERSKILKASEGSLVFEIAVGAASYAVMKKVIVDPLLTSYKSSNLHKELVHLFQNFTDEKTLFLTEKIREISIRRGYYLDVRHEKFGSPNSPKHIYIDKKETKNKTDRAVRTLGEELDKDS